MFSDKGIDVLTIIFFVTWQQLWSFYFLFYTAYVVSNLFMVAMWTDRQTD